MTFLRLSRGHLLAAVAALALLLLMAADWYTTAAGESLRRDEGIIESQQEEASPTEAEAVEEARTDASIGAEQEEETAWQASGLLDRLVLVLLLATVVAALVAAGLRAAGRRYPPPLTPSIAAAGLAAAGALLVTVRLIQVSGEPGGEIAPGAPLGLLALGLVAVGAGLAARSERTAAPEPAS